MDVFDKCYSVNTSWTLNYKNVRYNYPITGSILCWWAISARGIIRPVVSVFGLTWFIYI